jgi:hypothetical protein
VSTSTRVSIAPLTARFQYLERRYGWTAYRVAEDLNWTRKEKGTVKFDTTRVRRTLGLVDKVDGRGNRGTQQYTSYDQAVRLCRALDMDPFEAGV